MYRLLSVSALINGIAARGFAVYRLQTVELCFFVWLKTLWLHYTTVGFSDFIHLKVETTSKVSKHRKQQIGLSTLQIDYSA